MNKFFLSWRETLATLLFRRTVTVLTVLFCLGILIVFGNMYYFSQQLVKAQALESAIQSASSLKKARALYNSEIVMPLMRSNLVKVSHDYARKERAIPLPVTYLRALGHQITQSNNGMELRLYSDYPFPWRQEESGIKDDFEREALEFLRQNPESSFYRLEKINGRPMLRYAEADVLKPRCIGCHNSYPGTPKTDWKVGDVRGVLEINLSLQHIRKYINKSLKGTLTLLFTMSIVGVAGLAMSIRRIRQYSRELEKRVEVRQQAMEQAFTAIHNGPLQTLALLLREIQAQPISPQIMFGKLKGLDGEIREVGQNLTEAEQAEEIPTDGTRKRVPKSKIRLGEGTILELDRPLHELFYEIYTLTLQRNFPHFTNIRVKVRDFEPIDDSTMDIEIKRELCRWLEEVLCNVGKHAQNATRIVATGKRQEGWYILKVEDNGPGLSSLAEHQGTKYCHKYAQHLGGRFKRESLPQGGTLCELSWPLTGISH